MIALIKGERSNERAPVTHGGVVGQVWRGSARQANLARALEAVEVVGLGLHLGKAAGVLLGRAAQADAIDAALVLLARDGDLILASDVDDVAALATAADLHIDVVAV